MAIPRVFKKLNKAGVKMIVSCLKLCSLMRQNHDLEVLMFWMGFQDPYFHCRLRGVHPILEGVGQLTLLHLFGEANAMGIVPEEENQVNLKYLTGAIIASRSSTKSNYTTGMRFFCKGNGNRLSFVVKAFLVY